VRNAFRLAAEGSSQYARMGFQPSLSPSLVSVTVLRNDRDNPFWVPHSLGENP